jgi:4-diphosphocytidyl-2-C-methyl-D-erythritol kinase
MIIFPSCKINLGLRVPAKREDGYHEIETIFYPLPLQDALEAIIATPRSLSNIEFSFSGLPIAGDENDNLCVKAYKLLQQQFPDLPAVSAHLHKQIPMGAGLGGGSSDGAFMLRLLNDLLLLSLTEDELCKLSLQLGSDCPFFIYNRPCYATGRGEQLEPIPLSLKAYKIVLVYPALHVATGKAFAALNRNKVSLSYDYSLKQIIQHPVSEWKSLLINEFEESVTLHYPEIAIIKNKLYEAGAQYAAMTGSGSTVFGLFERDATLQFNFSSDYDVRVIDDLL